MSAILTSILIDVAAKVGAPIIKRILQDKVGGVAGELGHLWWGGGEGAE